MRKKKVLAFVVIAIGVSCSTYLLFSNSNVGASSPTIAGSERSDARFITSNGTLPLLNDPSFNATDQVIRDYERAIFEYNKGKKSGDAVKFPNDADIENIISKYTAQNFEIQKYTDADIKINKNSSLNELVTYLEKVENESEKIKQTAPSNIVSAIGLFVSEKNSEEIEKHISAQSKFIDTLLSTPVISEWRAFHISLLNNAEKKRFLSKIILENQEDPIKVVSAIKEIEGALIEEDAIWKAALEILKK